MVHTVTFHPAPACVIRMDGSLLLLHRPGVPGGAVRSSAGAVDCRMRAKKTEP